MLAPVDEKVKFASGGLKLAGLLRSPDRLEPGERRAAFLVLHGFGSNKDSANTIAAAKIFESLGYVTLRFDMRGCGDSEGPRGRVICLEQVEDTRSAFQFLQTRSSVHRIGVFG